MVPGAQAHVDRHRKALAGFFRRQRDESGLAVIDPDEWDDLLAALIVDQAERTVGTFGQEIARRFGATFDLGLLANYLAEYGRISAEATNRTTADELRAALDAEIPADAVDHVWTKAIGTRAAQMAVSKVTTEANLGRNEAAQQAGVKTKRWIVTSNKSRHPELNGETAVIGETFSNGALWPGDPSLPIDERAGCSCLVEF